MATYQDAIDRLSEKLRDSEAWPSDASKQSEQLYLLYNAAIAVLRGIPLSRLPVIESTDLPAVVIAGDVKEFSLPDTTFFFRPDGGIAGFYFDGKLHYPSQALPKESVLALQGNYMHQGRVLFAVDTAAQSVTAANVEAATTRHFPQPPLPAAPSDTYPLGDDNDFELAMSVVSAHVSGETIRDSGQSTFQTFLTQLYGDDIDVQE